MLGRAAESGEVQAFDLSSDQTPFRMDEKARVEACGARVCSDEERESQRPQNPDLWTVEDPPRCYLPEFDFPGTAFTRSLGDQVAKRIGVNPMPECLEYEVQPQDRFLILASDGVWEFMSSQEAVDVIKDCRDPKEAATELIMAAWDIWIIEDTRIDDITCVVAFLDYGEMQSASRSRR